MAAFKAFKSVGVMVFVHSHKAGERDQIPHPLKPAYSSVSGEPRIVIGNSDASEALGAISHEALKNDARKAARELKKKLATLDMPAEEPKPSLEAETNLLAPSQEWVNAKGQAMTAAVVKISGETVTFRMPNGKEIPYEIARLSEESKERLVALQKQTH